MMCFFSLARAERGRRQQGLIVRLAAAGRERDLTGVAAKVLLPSSRAKPAGDSAAFCPSVYRLEGLP